VQDLREEVEVAHEGSLQNNRDIAGVEKLDRVRYFVTTDASVTERKFNAESLYSRMTRVKRLMSMKCIGLKEVRHLRKKWSHKVCT
jgi:hypothetical protein